MEKSDLTFVENDAIIFTRPDGSTRRGIFVNYVNHQDRNGKVVCVQLGNDPFEVCVYEHQISPTDKETAMSPKADKPKAKDLRRQAKALGIANWEDMTLDELVAAVTEADSGADEATEGKKSKKDKKGKKDKKDKGEEATAASDDNDEKEAAVATKKSTTAKKSTTPAKTATKKAAPAKAAAKKATAKAPAKKAAAAPKEREVQANGNPFPKGSNLGFMTDLLIKGGKLEKIVDKVNDKLEIKERTVSRTPEQVRAEWHRRVVICSQKLRNEFNFTMDKEGRGLEATIKLTPPA